MIKYFKNSVSVRDIALSLGSFCYFVAPLLLIHSYATERAADICLIFRQAQLWVGFACILIYNVLKVENPKHSWVVSIDSWKLLLLLGLAVVTPWTAITLGLMLRFGLSRTYNVPNFSTPDALLTLCALVLLSATYFNKNILFAYLNETFFFVFVAFLVLIIYRSVGLRDIWLPKLTFSSTTLRQILNQNTLFRLILEFALTITAVGFTYLTAHYLPCDSAILMVKAFATLNGVGLIIFIIESKIFSQNTPNNCLPNLLRQIPFSCLAACVTFVLSVGLFHINLIFSLGAAFYASICVILGTLLALYRMRFDATGQLKLAIFVLVVFSALVSLFLANSTRNEYTLLALLIGNSVCMMVFILYSLFKKQRS